MSEELEIRDYKPTDLARLKEITVEAFEGVSIDQGIEKVFGEVNGRDWKWRKARHLDVDVDRDPKGIFVAEIDGRIAGYITTWMDREGGFGHIPNLALSEEARGRGVGRKLIEFALDRFAASGLSHARIETLVQNKVGNHVYESAGFVEVARQIHFAAELSGR